MLITEIQNLYNDGLCVRALAAGCAIAPLERWRGVDAAILAGRLANNLGAHRIGVRQHARAYRTAPERTQTRAYHLALMLGMRGPVFVWQRFRQYERELLQNPASETEGEGWEYLFTIGARICGMFRDFNRAEEYFKTAERHPSAFPWLLIERSAIQCMQECWDDALQMSLRALELRSGYRPAVQQAAQCLHTLNQNDEALRLLRNAAGQQESIPLLQQLASLEMDLERYEDALATLDRAEQLSPILDASNRKWMSMQRCRAAGAAGNLSLAEHAARQVGDDYHLALAERLKNNAHSWQRKQMTVPFIQQFRTTCVPATLTMLRHFWQLPADQVEVAEAICYDGTPTHRTRQWAESRGMTAREFTLTWDLAVALLDRQVPFAVFTAEATGGHVQVAVGYDELRRTLIIRDPAFPQIREVEMESFLRQYRASGPACMVLLPANEVERINGLLFPDSELYDRLRRIQAALERHQRAEAGTVFAELRAQTPDHWLTLTSGRAIHVYDTNSPALIQCLDHLLALFPEDGNLLLAKLGSLRETSRREERLDLLQTICARPTADPVFQQQLALELMVDARRDRETELALRRSLRFQPFNAFTLGTLANHYWKQRRFEEALDIYRFAAYLDDRKEPPASTYFSAALARRKTEEVLLFLQKRCEQNLGASPRPFFTWFNALQQCGRLTEALKQLEAALAEHPEHGELWLFAADIRSRHGDFERAEQCLTKAESGVQRGAFLKARAELARYRTDVNSSLSLWQEVLEAEPLAMEAHRAVAWLMAECSGRQAAIEHLQEACGRFPHHYQLRQLWCEWTRQDGPENAVVVIKELVTTHPTDAWARREHALMLTKANRPQEALSEAEEGLRLAPHNPVSHATRAHVRMALGLTSAAQDDYREAIRLAVDYDQAIYGLVNSGAILEERRTALGFIEQQLICQVVFGAGLQAYRDAARLNLEPTTLLDSLRLAHKARADLPVAWSVLIRQLAEMLQLEEALDLAEEATRRFPLLEQAWLDLGLVHRLRLDNAGECAALEQAMRVAPVSNAATKLLAEHYGRQGELNRVREFYLEACARQPLDAYSHGSLALVLWELGDQTSAIDRIQHAIRLQPGYGWGWQQLAQWSAATGNPQLAGDLAKLMALQRPGDVRSALVLARLLANTRLDESLQVVNRALKDVPRNEEAHELRAEILEALKRPEEANAACEPEIWKPRFPASLRACRARLEAQRGNLVKAIELLREVLKENPGDIRGWQSLSDWLWRRGEHKEATEAATNMRRLDPLNPIPLGYRASLKLQQGERVPAKADLITALKLDPAYTFASLNLFDLQLEDSEIDAAKRTLDLIKRHAGSEQGKACEIKLRTRFLQISAASKKKCMKTSGKTEPAEWDQAFQQFKELCSRRETAPEHINQAIQALLQAKQGKRLDQLLSELILMPESNPNVGAWWMERRFDQGRWYCPRKIHRLCPESPAARNAVIKLIECLGEQNREIGRTHLLAYVIITLAKLSGTWSRRLILLWLSRRHRHWLRQDDEAWATMGLSLFRLQRHRSAIRWMRDWREREGVKMWMLFNLVLAPRTCRRWDESLEVLERAVKLPQQDHSFAPLRLFLALELALRGDAEKAVVHFRELKNNGWSNYMQIQYRYAQGLLAVQQAPAELRWKTFRSERRAIKSLLAKYRVSLYRADYRRCLTRLARDAGQPFYVFLTWIGG